MENLFSLHASMISASPSSDLDKLRIARQYIRLLFFSFYALMTNKRVWVDVKNILE